MNDLMVSNISCLLCFILLELFYENELEVINMSIKKLKLKGLRGFAEETNINYYHSKLQ